MKNINLIYNSNGFLEEQYEDGSFYIAKEEDKALTFKATFPASLVGSVRAYLQFRGGGDVVECGNININSHTVECAVDAKYLSYNFLKIGFEVITANKEIRFEPVTIEVDEFVNVGGKSSAEGYTVTVKVGNVTKLAPDEEPYVKNVGTSKDVIFDFGIPKGEKGDTGEQGVQGEPGKDATIKIGTVTTLEPGSKATVTNNGTQTYAILNFGIPKGEKGDTGEQGVQGEPGYSPVKGKDYFTADEQQSFKEDVLRDVETQTFDYYYELNTTVENYNSFTAPGLYKIRHITPGVDRTNILLVTQLTSMRACLQLKITNAANIQKRQGNLLEDGTADNWSEWVSYATNADVNDAKAYTDEKIGDIETALDTIIAMQNELTGGGEV